MIFDDWQQEILDYDGHILLAKGRRIGATFIFAVKAVEWMMTHRNDNPTSQIVCASITEDQSQLIIAFALRYAMEKYPEFIGKGQDKPTLNKLTLKVKGNRRILIARPVGSEGRSSRGFEGQILMVDEAAFQPLRFFDAATPILMTTGGKIWMWSTFDGRDDNNYFWRNYEKAEILKDPKSRFKVWVKDSESVILNRPIRSTWTQEQRTEALRHLEEERADKSEMTYAQEYLAIAALDRRQFYSDAWIEKVCNLDDKQPFSRYENNFGGFDLARMGGDQFTAEIFHKFNNKDVMQIDHYTRKLLLTTDNEDLIMEYTRKWNCVKSGIDAGSGTLGVSVFDHLQLVDDMKRRIIAMNNREMSIDREEGKQRLFNEDMHDNLRSMGEKGEIRLFNRDDIKASLRSVQWELVTDAHGLTKVKIHGRFMHIAEGIIRGVFLAKDKHLNLFVSSIKI